MPYQRWEPPSTCHCGGGEALGVCHHGRGEADPHGLRTHRGGFLTFFHITVAVEKKGHPSSGQRHERHRLQSEDSSSLLKARDIEDKELDGVMAIVWGLHVQLEYQQQRPIGVE